MKVKVLNQSDIDFVGTFRDAPIHIPAGKSIEMGRSEAIQFLGSWSPMMIDGAGRHKQPKKLVMVEDPEERAERYQQPVRFNAVDGRGFRTREGLEAYEAKLQKDMQNGAVDDKPKRRRRVQQPEVQI